MLSFRLATFFVLAAILGFAIPAAPAEAVTIEVTVNNQPITSYDIDQRLKLMKLSNEKGGRKEAIESLVDELLQMQEASLRGLNADASRVNAAFATIAQQVKMTPAQLTQALNSSGIDADTLKRRLRAQMTWGSLVRARQAAVTQIDQADVTKALLATGETEKMTLKEFTLQQIIFVIPAGSSAGAITQRRREAEQFRQRFQGCENSIEQAKTLRGVVVKNGGRRDSAQLAGPQGEAILSTAAGKTTKPEQTAEGIEIIAVCSVREIESTAAARAEIENKLMLEQSEVQGDEYLADLRKRAVIKYR